jgi:3-oxoacyl-(acyl-carrier-protein) synthase
MKIFVTGMGLISSIGNNVEENLRSLKNSEGGINLVEGIPEMRKPFLGGQVKMDHQELLALSGGSLQEVHRSTLLGLIAAKEAWGNRKMDPAIRTGVIYGTTIGGINLNEFVLDAFKRNDPTIKVDYKYTHDHSFGTDFISSQLGIEGYKSTISTACSSAANSIMLGARLIRANILDRVLVGGAEAITNYILNGFDSLMLYDEERCRPFDETRKGLNLGEAGCFMVIENERSLTHTQQEKIAELTGWGNACDAFHQTASSPTGHGAVLAMNKALKMAGLLPRDIDYINTHGTATPNNDLSESAAMHTVFGNAMPPFSSTKSFVGHTLAAAGGVEAIYSVLAIRNNLVFPNLNYKEPMKEFNFRPAIHLQNKPIKNVLSSSFGFGGNCTELIFSE